MVVGDVAERREALRCELVDGVLELGETVGHCSGGRGLVCGEAGRRVEAGY